MSLVDRFRRPRLHDPQFGALRYARGRWTSSTATCFGQRDVHLRIPGSRDAIESDARGLLEDLERQYGAIRAQALPYLQEHYQPYAENADRLADPARVLIRSIRGPEDLWGHIKLVRVWVNAYGTPGRVELAYETAWDIEHTIGISISGGRITDFCGSVGPW